MMLSLQDYHKIRERWWKAVGHGMNSDYRNGSGRRKKNDNHSEHCRVSGALRVLSQINTLKQALFIFRIHENNESQKASN